MHILSYVHVLTCVECIDVDMHAYFVAAANATGAAGGGAAVVIKSTELKITAVGGVTLHNNMCI